MTLKFTQSLNRKLIIPLSDKEKAVLGQLYLDDGAWTRTEALSHLGESRFNVLLKERVLGRQNTDMGDMHHLLARGRISIWGGSDDSYSLQTLLDTAYVRLSLKQLKWEVLRPAAEGQTLTA